MRERLRAWTEKLETFLREVIVEERRGHARGARAGAALRLLEGLPGRPSRPAAFFTTSAFCATRPSACRSSPSATSPWGGTGKTPVVEKFARELRDQGRNVAILSRGYRSKPTPLHQRLLNQLFLRHDTTPPRVVSDGKSLLLDSEMAGDEPYMLASNLKDVVVLVDKDRVKSGRYAIEKFGCDTLLLDDGFQYWKLRGRRQDIVLVDRQQPFGTERLLPRGTLREPPSHLARASTIFITKSDGNTAELRRRIAQFNPTAGIIECIHHPLYLEDVFTGQRLGLEFAERAQGRVPERHRAARRASSKASSSSARNWSIPSALRTTIGLRSRRS